MANFIIADGAESPLRAAHAQQFRSSLHASTTRQVLFDVDLASERHFTYAQFDARKTRDFLKEVDDFAKSVDGYIDWTYINYADKAQNPLGSLLDPKGIQRVALKYDPEGVFQNKTPGGFKISDYTG